MGVLNKELALGEDREYAIKELSARIMMTLYQNINRINASITKAESNGLKHSSTQKSHYASFILEVESQWEKFFKFLEHPSEEMFEDFYKFGYDALENHYTKIQAYSDVAFANFILRIILMGILVIAFALMTLLSQTPKFLKMNKKLIRATNISLMVSVGFTMIFDEKYSTFIPIGFMVCILLSNLKSLGKYLISNFVYFNLFGLVLFLC